MAKRHARIAVVGSINADLTSFIDQFPRPGETVLGDSFDLGFGGKGANQAVAARYCGAEVEMVGRVGDDLFGAAMVENFESLGIGTRHVKTVKGVSSGVAPILVDRSGQNRIVVVKGANDELTAQGVDRAAAALKSADVIILQFEIPLAVVYHTIQFARKHEIRCIVNPAPAAAVDFKKLAGVDYFIPNETEAATIAGKPVNTVDQAKACGEHLLSRGVGRVILTLGDKGALLVGAEGAELIPSYEVEAKDTTGAGDAFIGSFAVFLAEGMAERDAIARANLYAGLSTTRVGTQKSFLTRRQFDREWKARTRG